MNYHFWLGDYRPHADEAIREYEANGNETGLIEEDGFITVVGLKKFQDFK